MRLRLRLLSSDPATFLTKVVAQLDVNLWDLLLEAFPPRSPQVVAGLIAAAAVNIMRGPDHATADATKAFKHWDAAVSNLLHLGDVCDSDV
jgi:hypothetical protein